MQRVPALIFAAIVTARLDLAGDCVPGGVDAQGDPIRQVGGRHRQGLGRHIVVIRDDRIASVGAADSAIPADAHVIDLTRYTGIPGLIDVHTHMTFHWDRAPGTRPGNSSRSGRRRQRLPRPGECPQDPGDGRHDGARPRRLRIRRHRHARPDPSGRDDRAADVRRRLRAPDHRPAGATRIQSPVRRQGRRSPRSPARRPPAGRRGSGRHQDVRLDRQRPGRLGRPDIHLRRNESRRRRRASPGQTDRDPFLRPRRRTRRRTGRGRLDRARDGHRRPDPRGDVPKEDLLRPHHRPQSLLHRVSRAIRLRPGCRPAAARLSPAEPGDRAARAQGRRPLRHGFRRGLHDVRPEHPRARLVRQGRDDPRRGITTATTHGAALLGKEKSLGAVARGSRPISWPSRATPSRISMPSSIASGGSWKTAASSSTSPAAPLDGIPPITRDWPAATRSARCEHAPQDPVEAGLPMHPCPVRPLARPATVRDFSCNRALHL